MALADPDRIRRRRWWWVWLRLALGMIFGIIALTSIGTHGPAGVAAVFAVLGMLNVLLAVGAALWLWATKTRDEHQTA